MDMTEKYRIANSSYHIWLGTKSKETSWYSTLFAMKLPVQKQKQNEKTKNLPPYFNFFIGYF